MLTSIVKITFIDVFYLGSKSDIADKELNSFLFCEYFYLFIPYGKQIVKKKKYIDVDVHVHTCV